MQSERLHIDEFFRKKEEEWDAGNDDLQIHWQHMLTLMSSATAVPASKPSYFRLLKLGAKLLGGVLTLAVMVAIVVYLSKREEVIKEKQPQKNEAAVAVVAELASKQDTVSTVQANPSPKSVTAPAPAPQKLPRLRRNASHGTDTVAPVDAVTPDAATLMTVLYESIKKQSQEFDIPADRDTTITGIEGTLLTIKAFTFSDDQGPVKTGNVKIRLTEYYRNDDIVAAKLSTTSNGQQLETGGMIHIAAESNGLPVNVTPGKTIQVKMPTNDYDERMQLFSDARQGYIEARYGSDTLPPRYDFDGSEVNWIPAGQSQQLFGLGEENGIDILDLSVAPYRVRYGKLTVARFFYDNELKADKNELREKLYLRYGTYYDKIILKKAGKRERRQAIDNTSMRFEDALAARLVSREDSMLYVQQKGRDSAHYMTRLKTLKYYNFNLPSTGWFNCDLFASNPNPRIDFTIDLGEGYEAGEFVTHLVFTRVRSTVMGFYNGNQVRFRGIPEKEPAFIVCIGVKDGKYVSSMAPLTTGPKQINLPAFEETSPEAFRQKLGILNQSGNPR